MKWISSPLLVLILSFSQVAQASWLMDYYKNPTPDKFVAHVIKFSEQGVLANPKHTQTLSVFLSRILADNPERIEEWMAGLQGLTQQDMKIVFLAVWLSDTEQSKKYLRSIGATTSLATKPTDILQATLNHPAVLDGLWGYFFATGSKEPIRRIITAFNYDGYLGSIDAYKTSQQTEQDKQNVLMEAVFAAARWSLASNIKKHARVAQLSKTILNEPGLSKSENIWLAMVLSKEPIKQ